MTAEEVNRIKYIVCCPMCDNEKCVRKTDKCEAEIWAKCKTEEEMMRNREELSKYRKILLEIQKEIKDCNLILYKDGVFFIPQYEVLNIIDKYIAEAKQ